MTRPLLDLQPKLVAPIRVCALAVVWSSVLVCGCNQAAFKEQSGTKPSAAHSNPQIAERSRLAETPPAGTRPLFHEVAESKGVRFIRNDDIRGQHRLMEANGGGIAASDFDNDGWPDLYFTNGCRLPLKERDGADTNAFFLSDGTGGFRNATTLAGLQAGGYFTGCTSGDFDGDGFEDLYVAAYGDNILYHNQGDGTFRDMTVATGTAVGKWSTSPAFADLNLDGNLDLFVVTYVQASDDPPTLCPEPACRDGYIQCSPTMFRATADVLFLGDGQGGFIDVTTQSGVAGVDGKGLGIAIFDADGDHLPDVFIANDGTPNFLYTQQNNDSVGTTNDIAIPKYLDCAFDKGVAVSAHGKAQAGMGVAVADADGDGWPDIVVTNFFGEPNSFFKSHEGHSFEDVSAASGIGPPSRPMLGFGVEFLDLENDGWPDLFVTNGHVDDLTSFTSVPYRMPSLVYRSQHNGTFIDVTRWAGESCQKPSLGRGLAILDLDRDGRLDLAISTQRGPSEILHNATTAGHSCCLRLVGTDSSNRSAFHTRIEVEGLDGPAIRQIIGGGSFQSASERIVHIGMGQAQSIPQIKIRWPNGATETYPDLGSGHHVVVQGRRPVSLSY